MAEPQLASASHLSASSPCRGAGSAGYLTGVDIDGEAWLSPPSIGCDEYRAGAVTGALTVAIGASRTNITVDFAVDLTGWIGGRVAASAWDFGDGMALSNRPYASHAWGAAGDYPVVLRAYNESHPEGVSATVTIRVVESLRYVSAASTSPVPPYSSWATAARTIQEAVDAAQAGDTVLVTNGVYATGGRTVGTNLLANRVAVDRPVEVRSVNGPAVTVIRGYQVPGTTNGDGAVRCVYLTDGAVLSGFTLTNGATRGNSWPPDNDQDGGGVWCQSSTALVINCTLTGDSASWSGGGANSGTLNNCVLTGNSAQVGGGAYQGTLNNCTITGNSAQSGGGVYDGALNNCTLTGNSASTGGGVYSCGLNNCILYYNAGKSGPNYDTNSALTYCCTMPLPADGTANSTNPPLFVNLAGGDLHLQTNSPCINAGLNAYAPGATDLDGNPRISGGTVDVGAYEFQFLDPFHLWLQSYGLPTDGSADYVDTDNDGLNNWQEWLAGTNPTNAASVLRLQRPLFVPGSVTLTWTSATNRAYFVERAANLALPPTFSLLQTNIPGLPDTTSFTDTNSPVSGPAFYRVGVQP